MTQDFFLEIWLSLKPILIQNTLTFRRSIIDLREFWNLSSKSLLTSLSEELTRVMLLSPCLSLIGQSLTMLWCYGIGYNKSRRFLSSYA